MLLVCREVCNLSTIRYVCKQLLCFKCHLLLFFFFFYKVFELVGGGSVINGATLSSLFMIRVLQTSCRRPFLHQQQFASESYLLNGQFQLAIVAGNFSWHCCSTSLRSMHAKWVIFAAVSNCI